MKDENYWSLILENSWVQASIWKLDESILHVLTVGKPSNFEQSEFVESVDAALSSAIQSFPEDEKEPSKTVFGVPPSWVSEGQINKEHLEEIRHLCSKLSLSPTGFVVLPEAIAHSIKVQEGSPLTGIVIGVSDNVLDVSVFKLGNIVGSVNVGRSVSVVEDIIEGLARFATKEPVPTRILLYDGKSSELEDVKQKMIDVDWDEKSQGRVKFLHTPQIEIISPEAKAIAVSVAGASEISDVNEVKYNGEKLMSVSQDSSHAIKEESNVQESNDLSDEEIGFVIDQDISEVQRPDARRNDDETAEPHGLKGKSRSPLSKIKGLIPKFHLGKHDKKPDKALASLKVPQKGSRLKKVAILLTILTIVGVGGLFAAWWYIPKAEVVIYVAPKTLEEKETLTLDENIDSSKASDMTFPVERITVQVEDTKSRQTTGTKTVGEKAEGKVKIRNGTSSGISFSKGDVLVGPNELKFSLSESASVSAALSPTEPGEVTVSAQAYDIGAEYNLASGETFSISGYSKSDVDAVVDTDFSGGSSKEIVAVSQSDLSTLKEELTADLKRKGLTELENKSVDLRFVPDSVNTKIITTDFSNSVGDEASSISLNLKMEVSGIGISNSTVEDLINQVLAPQVPNGFKLRPEQVDSNFTLVEDLGKGVYDFDVDLVANLLPEVNLDQIKNDIKGKYPPEAEGYLATIPGYSSAEVRLSPRFPGKLGVIPRLDNNISIEIVAEK